jgi:hypothetical protein
MRLLSAIVLLTSPVLGSAAEVNAPMDRSLQIAFEYQAANLDCLYEIEDRIKAALEISGGAVLDGYLISTDRKQGSLYLFATDGQVALKTIMPILSSASCLTHVVAAVSLGPIADPGSKMEMIAITP